MTTPRASRTFLDLLCPASIAFAALLACLPILVLGAPNGHSLPLDLIWMREFSGQLLAGELYPRWLSGMNGGAGSPTFFYYAPFPFYVASLGPLLCSSCKPTIQLALGEWLLLALSGISFYGFAKRSAGLWAATAAAIVYMLLPYHFEVDLWHRQAVAEFAAYIWLPLPLLFIDKVSKGENGLGGLALSYALLIFTHLPSALLLSPFLVLYAGHLSLRARSPIPIAKFSVGVVLGVLISSIYLLPALLTQDEIASRFWWMPYFQYDRWFFLDAADEPNIDFGNRLFFDLVLTSAVFALWWLAAYLGRAKNQTPELFQSCSFVALAWFLMTPVSRPIWEWFPVLQKVQFPWRIAIAIDLAVAMTAARAFDCSFGKGRRVSSTLTAIALALFAYAVLSGGWTTLRSLDAYQSPQFLRERDHRIERGRDAPEFFPASVKLGPRRAVAAVASMDQVEFDRSKGRVRVMRWAPRDIAIDVELSQPAELVVRQFYYPGWRAETTRNSLLEIEPTATTGLIKIAAPAGRYGLSLELARLPEEKAGALLSALGLALVFSRPLIRAWRSARRGAGS